MTNKFVNRVILTEVCFIYGGGINNDYKTVFDVIDMGLGYLVNVYDTWKVEKVLDDYHKPFLIPFIGNLGMY